MKRILLRTLASLAVASLCADGFAHPGHRHSNGHPAREQTPRVTAPAESPPVVASTESRGIDRDSLTVVAELLAATSEEQLVAWRIGEFGFEQVLLNGEREFAMPRTKTMFVAQEGRPTLAAAFAPFVAKKAISTRQDDRYFYVESNGVPDHPLMVGITSWQQQVPIPQAYRGDNAWRIPLVPVEAKRPRSTKGEFLRGAIALAVNGIPIFNPLNNRGDDAFLAGELDEYGGHCGRADDYHYHLAPVHLEKIVGSGKPIAYALDGYPIYGYLEPDGSPVGKLDAFNGHVDAQGNYHYHASKTYPYLNGGFHGEVVERDGQVDPQPRAEPLRPSLPPLRGARIVAFSETSPNNYRLTYEQSGKKGTVTYSLSADRSAKFTFVDPQGRTTTETYSARGGRRGGEGGPRGGERKNDRPPPPPRDEPRNTPPPKPSEPARKAAETSKRPSTNPSSLVVTSDDVDQRGMLSIDCTCDGKGSSPAISWKNAPAGTQSFAISLWHTAPDQEKSYWLVYDIPANTTGLKQNATGVGVVGINDRKRQSFDPMCSKGPGIKTYHVTVFALSRKLDLPAATTNRAKLLAAVKDITLAETTFDFNYERK